MLDPSSSDSVPTFSTPDFTAVLLAGGRSTRMGEDKAGLLIQGEPLWQRQIRTLLDSGAKEVFVSGRVDGPYAGAGFRVIEDSEPDLGPLGGIVAALQHSRFPLLLVLAVDLPRMTSDFLRPLIARAPIVPRRGDRFEPLAAVYAKKHYDLLRQQLIARELSLQRILGDLVRRELIEVQAVQLSDAPLFDNLNTPEDLAYFTQG